jgi:hypothetical protein
MDFGSRWDDVLKTICSSVVIPAPAWIHNGRWAGVEAVCIKQNDRAQILRRRSTSPIIAVYVNVN